jgi:aspartate/methionine/tyrosine aminotransferase
MTRTSARLAAIAPSATLAVDSKAKAMQAAGENVIGFGAGEPDFPTPQHIVDAAIAACADPKNHKYTPAGGLPELKQAICDKTLRDSGFAAEPANVLVTCGGKHAVYTAFAALCDPGDEVLCPAPYWTTYPEAITLAGGVPVIIDTDAESGFQVTIAQLDAAKTDKTKVLLFVCPDNPSGAVYPPAAVKAIGEWAVANGVWVITDEIYEHLTYGAHEFSSMPVLCPDIADQCIIVNGVAKTYAMTGWRVGWMIGPADVIKASTNFQSHATSNVSNVAQRAAIAAVSGPLDDVVMMREAFARRAVTMHQMLNAIANTTIELADIILEEAKVAFVPGEAFGLPGYGRFSFALGDEDLAEGIQRIADLVG